MNIENHVLYSDTEWFFGKCLARWFVLKEKDVWEDVTSVAVTSRANSLEVVAQSVLPVTFTERAGWKHCKLERHAPPPPVRRIKQA